MKKTFYLLILTTLSLISPSCRPLHEVIYFQQTDTINQSNTRAKYPNFEKKDENKKQLATYIPIIQPFDILSVTVSSLSKEASSIFTTNLPDNGLTLENFSTEADIGYLIDEKGFIDMPLLGKVKLAGYSTSEARDTITSKLEKYLQAPLVKINIINFKITVLGDVTKPGIYNVTNEKISIPQALAIAGDLTIFGDRQKVLLIREIKGEKTYTTIDLTKRELFISENYYLHSNDILYIPPVKGKIAQTENVYRVLPLVISSITLLTVLAVAFKP